MINNAITIVIIVFATIGALSTFVFICDFFAERSVRRDEAKLLEQTVKRQNRDIAILESQIRTLNSMITAMRLDLINSMVKNQNKRSHK